MYERVLFVKIQFISLWVLLDREIGGLLARRDTTNGCPTEVAFGWLPR